jgi:hypothetical protein
MSPRRAPGRPEEPQKPPEDDQTTGDAAAAEADTDDDSDAGDEPDRDALVEQLLPARVQDALKLDPRFAGLLAEACYVFGLNPDPTVKPIELAAFRCDPGDPNGVNPTPASVVLVTGGGLKIRYPIDEDTENRLRIVYNAYKVNTKTGEREVLPLPPDLALPREHVDGVVRTADHQYRTGYLREGGKAEAARREQLRSLRQQGKLGKS